MKRASEYTNCEFHLFIVEELDGISTWRSTCLRTDEKWCRFAVLIKLPTGWWCDSNSSTRPWDNPSGRAECDRLCVPSRRWSPRPATRTRAIATRWPGQYCWSATTSSCCCNNSCWPKGSWSPVALEPSRRRRGERCAKRQLAASVSSACRAHRTTTRCCSPRARRAVGNCYERFLS